MKLRPNAVVWAAILLFLVIYPGSSSYLMGSFILGSQGSISFAAAGDLGNTTQLTTRLSLQGISASGVDFFTALGDLSYMSLGTESQWCEYVHNYVSQGFPFELISGNHEAGSATSPGPNGYIGNFASCLPDKIEGLSYNDGYAKEYYIDYPTSSPLVRIILIAADLTIDGTQYYYTVGSQHYNWVSNAIDSARASGIQWVIVGLHKDCITMGRKTCEIGTDLMNLLIQKRVDLVLEGHDHNYQRSKQLTCAQANLFSPQCVANDGSDNTYQKGAGTVFVIQGSFGRSLDMVNASDSEAQYFAKAWGGNGYWDGRALEARKGAYGFMKYTVSSSLITAEFVNTTGTFTDTFTVTTTSHPPASFWSLLFSSITQPPGVWILAALAFGLTTVVVVARSNRKSRCRRHSAGQGQAS